MKLIKTYNSDGTPDGYFDPQTRCIYNVGSPGFTPPQPKMFRAQVSEGEHTYQFLSPLYQTREEAMAELDRLAALIEGKAPAQGWVEGPPPERDGLWFLVVVRGDKEPLTVKCLAGADLPWTDTAGNGYFSSELTHHLPTPIQPPKES